MNILFSVLIPAYKAAYLQECLDSVLCQTYNEFEIVIVNDASPEGIDEIVGSYNDKRIKYYRNEINCGAENVVKNWNKCLDYSTGEYIICMGDDDRLLPNCLKEYYHLIMKYPGIGLLHGWTEIIDSNSSIIELTTHRCEYESAMSLLWHRIHAYSSQFIGDFCFNATLLKKEGGFHSLPLAWGSDDISAIKAASYSGVANTQQVVFQYRRSIQTISSGGNLQQKMVAVREKEKWLCAFLLNSICTNKEDELYRTQLFKDIPTVIDREKSVLIYYSFKKESLFKVFYWFKHKKDFGLTTRTILKGIIKSLA